MLVVDLGTTDKGGQLVRWLPHSPNNAAGKQWLNFCKKYDGDVGNGQRTPRPNNAQVKDDDEVYVPLNFDILLRR